MKPLRIKWESHYNPECETLHCDVRLPKVCNYVCVTTDGSDAADELLEYMTAIPGVANIHANNYEMMVTRGGVFSWDEIRPAVEAAVIAFTRAHDVIRVE